MEGYSTSVQKYDTNVQVYKVSCFLSLHSTTVTTESKFQMLLRLLYYCSVKWIHLMKKDQLTYLTLQVRSRFLANITLDIS